MKSTSDVPPNKVCFVNSKKRRFTTIGTRAVPSPRVKISFHSFINSKLFLKSNHSPIVVNIDRQYRNDVAKFHSNGPSGGESPAARSAPGGPA